VPVRRMLVVTILSALLTALTPLGAVSTASAASAEQGRTVTYAGFGVQVHLGEEGKLGATSPAFRRFVHDRLLRLWRLAGSTEKCRPAATVIVKTWTSAGFARAGEGTYSPCPSGGYGQLYLVRDGKWTAPRVLGSQEARSCSLMRWFEIPGRVADRACYTDLGRLVKYRSYELPADYSTGDHAARVLAGVVENGSGVAVDWADTSVVDELYRMKDDGAEAFTVKECFGQDDPAYGAVLGKAPRGCLLDVFYGDYRVLAVLRLYHARFGRWSAHSIQPVAST
jgi:hypothetical protein